VIWPFCLHHQWGLGLSSEHAETQRGRKMLAGQHIFVTTSPATLRTRLSLLGIHEWQGPRARTIQLGSIL
jgi:hypothetical protein